MSCSRRFPLAPRRAGTALFVGDNADRYCRLPWPTITSRLFIGCEPAKPAFSFTSASLSASSGDAGLDACLSALSFTTRRGLNTVGRRHDFPPFKRETPQSRPLFPLLFGGLARISRLRSAVVGARQCLTRFRAEISWAHRSHPRWGKHRRAPSIRLRSASPIAVPPSEVHAHEQVELVLAGENGIGSNIAHEGKLQAEKRQRRAVCLFHAHGNALDRAKGQRWCLTACSAVLVMAALILWASIREAAAEQAPRETAAC